MDQLLSFIFASLFIGFLCMPMPVKKNGYSWSSVKSGTLTCMSSVISAINERFNAWMFLFRGPSMIQEAYKKANGNPFWIQAPENRYLVVSSWDHIKEIDAASDDVLSLQAAAKEILQPRYTMQNFNWFDKKGADGMPLIRTLRTLLTNHLPDILPDIRRSMSAFLDRAQDSQPVVNGSYTLPVLPTVIETISLTNAAAFFGSELSQNEKFMAAAISFIEQTLLAAEAIRVLPKAIAPFIGSMIAKNLGSGKTIYDALIPIAEERLEERAQKKLGHVVPEHHDCIQWVMECSPRSKPWSAERIVHELMALWFGSVHITSTTACIALHHLCLHSEYIEPLRNEIENTGWAQFEQSGGKAFPLLDSFMKESARINPVESVSSRRMALKPFELSDGTRVEAGEWICTAARGMMLDARYYAGPQEFQGFRFVDASMLKNKLASDVSQGQGTLSNFTDIGDWQLWGTGRSACPGRFYATAVMKTLLALFITKYDMRLEDKAATRYFAWRTFIYPYASTKVTLRPRAVYNS
ncbi:cytochrome P450 [Trichoderma austrokoningii]